MDVVKRSLTAAAVGFVLGYTYAFVSCLVASKGIGIRRPAPELTGEDMHDVLPTDDGEPTGWDTAPFGETKPHVVDILDQSGHLGLGWDCTRCGADTRFTPAPCLEWPSS